MSKSISRYLRRAKHRTTYFDRIDAMRYLGIDYGTKKTGIALSDEAGTMGFPKDVLPTKNKLVEKLCLIIKNENVGAVIMGESKNFAGDDNSIAKDANALAQKLFKETKVPVFFEPEMLTTQEARRFPTGERARGGDVDAAAAALILTSYLSRQ